MVTSTQAEAFQARLDRHLSGAGGPAVLAVGLLAEAYPHYHWVGVYWLEGQTLVLGPYVGAATEHDRIPVGRGVCGTAVAEGKNQVVADVQL